MFRRTPAKVVNLVLEVTVAGYPVGQSVIWGNTFSYRFVLNSASGYRNTHTSDPESGACPSTRIRPLAANSTAPAALETDACSALAKRGSERGGLNPGRSDASNARCRECFRDSSA